MEKMQSVYKDNPKLGDPNSLGQSLEQTSQKIAALVEERDKFQVCVCVQGFIQDFLVCVVGKKFVGHCHSVMHEFATHAHTETIQIFKFSGGEFKAPPSVVCVYVPPSH